MIEVKYEIFEDDKEELSVIDLITFDNEYGQIYGLFTITIGEHDFIPYPSNDITIPAKRIYSELILTHLELLNDVVKLLSNNNYLALKYIENYWTWLEFVKVEGNLIKISELSFENTSLESPLCTDETLLKGAVIGSIKDVYVPKDELVFEIKKKTKLFIEEISCINPILLKSKYFSKILRELRY